MRALAPVPLKITRRKCLQSLSTGVSLLFISEQSRAGAQIEEPLIDSVRNALSAAIHSSSPPKPEFQDTASRLAYLRWLGEMSQRLKRKVADHQERIELLQTVWYESRRAGLDVSLVLGLI